MEACLFDRFVLFGEFFGRSAEQSFLSAICISLTTLSKIFHDIMGPGWKLVYLIDLFSLANREFFGHLRVGRPKLPGSLIRLRESVFNLWRDSKEALGFSERTVSLQNSCYIEGEVCCSTEQLHHLCTCTPLVPLLT